MPKTNKKKFSLLFDILTWTIVIVSVFITVLSLSTKDKGVSSIFGKVLLSIQSESMEPTIMTGDLIVTDDYQKNILKNQDIISFFAVEEGYRIIKTHRIVEVKNIDGLVSYVTQGDNNPVPDGAEVAPGDIVSVYKGVRIGSLGKVLDLLKSKWGFFIFIIVPLFVFLVYQFYVFIVLIIENKKEQIIAEANLIHKE